MWISFALRSVVAAQKLSNFDLLLTALERRLVEDAISDDDAVHLRRGKP